MEDDPSTLSDSPSLAFLRDLAHVSDQAPNPFDLQLAARGTDPGSDPTPSGAPESARFLVRQKLGAGGFGAVYEAFDRERNATVALKALQRRDARAVSRFKHEFRSLCEIAHENLVQLYELHAEGDAWFFTMELVRGVDALTYVRGEPGGAAFDEARLRGLLRQLAGGLSFLHRSGKLHRDVKPSNVMVTGEGRVVLLDFGLVADLGDPQPDEGVLGTPAYMAPEQAAGLPVGTAADWYAVGVMLYEALAGRLPFAPGERHAAPQRPSVIAGGVPGDLDRLCVELLSRAPEKRPHGREVRARLSKASAGARSGGEPPARERAPFIGRAAHVGALREALGAADAGRAVVVLLHGRSGMGKSTLIQRFLKELREREPRRLSLSGRCFEQESVPYKAVDGLVDDLCRRLQARAPAERAALLPADFPTLARLFPQLRQLSTAPLGLPADPGQPANRRRAFAALRDILRAGGPETACPALAIDDLQWGDLDSVALLAELLQGGEAPAPILLVAAYRTEETEANPVLRAFTAALADLGERVAVRTLEVGELHEVDAEALSRSLLEADGRSGDALAETAVRAIVAEAHGSPFLLAELARHRPGGWHGGETMDSRSETGPALPQDPTALLGARIGRLAEPTRRLLEVVAVAGQPVARAVAASAAYGSEPESQELAAFGLLRAGRLLRAHGRDELLPYHDRIRETVMARLDPEAARGHHERLALALEAAGSTEPERLLFHFRGAGRRGDALRYAERAAALAHQAMAFDRAARLYREALALGDASARENHARLGDALAGAGRPREAAQAYLEAARGAAPGEALSSRQRAVELLLTAGYLEEGQATLRDVLREVGILPPSSPARSLLSFAALQLRLSARGLRFDERPASAVGERALVRVDACYAAALGLGMVNPFLAAESQARHLLVALEVGEPYRVARALGIQGIFSVLRRGQGHPSTDRLIGACRDIGARLGHPHLTGLALLSTGLSSMVSGRWQHALDRLAESESLLRARCTGVWWEIDLCQLYRATCLWMLGEIEALARLTPALLDEARERGNRHVETTVQLLSGQLCALARDQPGRARENLAAGIACWPRRPGSFHHLREVAARARLALYEGENHAARAVIDEAWPAFFRGGLLLTPVFGGELRLLRAVSRLAAGDLDGAARGARVLSRSPIPWAAGISLVIRATLAQRRGDVGSAVRALVEAGDRARRNGGVLFEAALQRRRGEWLGGDAGRAAIAAADARMGARGVAAPMRMTRMLFGPA